MAERKRSNDGHRETEEVLGEKPENLPESPDHAGSAGGELNRKVGKRDEEKQVDDTSAGNTRPKAQDTDDSGDKEKV
ncbi:hypothetical protein SAMN05421853_11341 [Roseivivax halotolerans]|jgi:hypothetical protein|uniref:Uncharacterized protein n=1 Tax=Roseivivax halotolerans TaxID=93684 RepID=A0A1I5ZYS7_9RHOB|nr:MULTISPECIES: hypothetical protein [Roseivivax]QFT63101.1 hypothetical protein FIU91_09210 [Roseivivax sp. THAF30]SFQ61493.1 hypothetical protein SAMN05421853_11341 [Roseivivax halotolerans]